MVTKIKVKKKTSKSKEHNEIENLKNQLIRALADYDNLRKRTEVEIEERARFMKGVFILKVLSIYDMLVSAQKHSKDSGIAIVIEELNNIFKEEGVEKIVAKKGDKFDEELLDAVEAVDEKAAKARKKQSIEGTVAETVLVGWKFADGPIIRPAKVKVYKEG